MSRISAIIAYSIFDHLERSSTDHSILVEGMAWIVFLPTFHPSARPLPPKPHLFFYRTPRRALSCCLSAF
jgi:hypothetical protein